MRLVDVGEFVRFARFRRSEFLLAAGTTAAVLVVGVLAGVLVAIGLSVLDLLRRVARPHDAIEGYVPGLAGMHDVDDYPTAEPVAGLLVYRYDSPLFFANAEDFRRRALAAVEQTSGPVEWFVLNTEAIVEVDITAMDVLEDLRRELTDRGTRRRLGQGQARPAGRARAHRLPGADRRGPHLPDPAHRRRGVPSVAGPRGLTPGCSTGVVCDGSARGSRRLRRVSAYLSHGLFLWNDTAETFSRFHSSHTSAQFSCILPAVTSRQFGR